MPERTVDVHRTVTTLWEAIDVHVLAATQTLLATVVHVQVMITRA